MYAYACSGLLLFTALVHSILGERRLITPLLRSHEGVLGSELARFLLRFVWHFMSILFAVLAAAILAHQHSAGAGQTALLLGTTIGVGGAGVIDALATRGRHIGWPLLVLIGLFSLLQLLTDP